MRKRIQKSEKSLPENAAPVLTVNEPATAALTKTQERRNFLKEISGLAKKLVEKGEFEKLNDAIIATFYKKDEHQVFKTYNQWKRDGFQPKKGSKSFVVWGKPMSARAKEKGQVLAEDQHDFYPLCFLFSNAQVEKIPFSGR